MKISRRQFLKATAASVCIAPLGGFTKIYEPDDLTWVSHQYLPLGVAERCLRRALKCGVLMDDPCHEVAEYSTLEDCLKKYQRHLGFELVVPYV